MNINNNNKQNPNNENQRRPRFNFTWLYMILFGGLVFMYFFSNSSGSSDKQLGYTDFQACLDSGYVKEILVNKDNLTLKFAVDKKGEKYIYNNVQSNNKPPRTPVIEFGSLTNLEQKIDSAKAHNKFTGKVSYERENDLFWNILIQIGPIVLIVIIWFFIMGRMGGGALGGGGGIFSFGKSKATLFEQGEEKDRITFKDVAGQTEAKREVHEIVDFLKNPSKYTELGGKIPKGALLVGPPGTGKTLLAKAVAGEANVPFFSMSGSDFVEMFVGVGASRVRDLFQQAKTKAPCIIFIDEIDAIGRARGKNLNMGGNDERENTLNQLLTEMDGFGTNSGVIILAATNRAEILDKALLRAGRFDRQIHVDLPDLNERKAIFNVHLRPIKIDETVDVDTLARQTPGFSGADIANVCNEAALIAARNNSKWVNKQCFLDAVDRIIGGLEKKTKVMTNAEKRTIALHEAGHATISWFCQYANPLVKVTIVPRGQALGAAWYMPEERQITTKEELLDEICATLGGRAAEEVCTGRISTGAVNDLETVTKRSYGMIAYAGMSKSLPNLCYYNNDEYTFSKPYSEHTAELIDEEVKRQINEQYERAKKILLEHKEGHERLAQLLIDREVIYAEDVENIFGKRPWISRTEEILAANEQSASMEDDSMNHANENAEIIRNKAIEAVLEKAKEKQNMSSESVDNGTADNKESQNLKKGPQPFHELKVTNSNPVEDAITSEVSNEISEDINIEKTDNEIPENNSESADSYKNYEDNKTNDNEVLEYKEIANTESSNNDETSVDNIDISDKGNNSSKANKNDEVKKKNLTNLQ
ncbi:MAG: ATP-dependent zinc metalloprotease FtsH [Bacteroidaceae bacterium]|nr:ATP-dependent zinc metalloprotease FtsH [Bacteroidaceae bacterium]